MVPESVDQKLKFARLRLVNVMALIDDNRLTNDPDARQQLTQEFFFHLVGATDYLAQLVPGAMNRTEMLLELLQKAP